MYGIDSDAKIRAGNPAGPSAMAMASDEEDVDSLIPFDDFDDFPTMPKRDSDYGHMRFGRASPGRIAKRPLGKKIESDYGHFRFG